MPFDGSTTKPEIAVLRALLAFFGDDSKWLWRSWTDERGGACLEQALSMICTRQSAANDRTRAYLMRAILQHHPMTRCLEWYEVQEFSDVLCSGIDELRATIRLAIVLAENYDLDRLPYPPAGPEPWRAWAGWGDAARQFRGLERASPEREGCQAELFPRRSIVAQWQHHDPSRGGER